MKKIISLNLSSNGAFAPQSTITEDELTWLATNFGYFTNETLVSGGMRGIERKDDDSCSITDPVLGTAIHNLLLIKNESFNTIIKEVSLVSGKNKKVSP
jgi:hypothetical protein